MSQDTAWSGDEILAEAQVWVRRLACICFAAVIIAEVITGKVQGNRTLSCMAIGRENGMTDLECMLACAAGKVLFLSGRSQRQCWSLACTAESDTG